MPRCDKCDSLSDGVFFTEVYNPQTGQLKTVYLCERCMNDLYGLIVRWTEDKTDSKKEE